MPENKVNPDSSVKLYIDLCAQHYLGKPHRDQIRALAHNLVQSGVVPKSCAPQDLQNWYQHAIDHNTLDIHSFAVDIVTEHLLSDATYRPLYHQTMHKAWKICNPRRSEFFSPWFLTEESASTRLG